MKSRIVVFGLLVVLLSSLLPFSIYVIVSFTFLVMILLPIGLYMDNIALLLMLFSAFYSFTMFFNETVDSYFNLISYILSPTVFYLLGKYLVHIKVSEEGRLKLMLLLVLAFMTPILEHTLKDIHLVGIINPTRAMLSTINETSMGATLYGLNASVGIGCVSVLFLKKQRMLIKLGYIFATCIAILTTIHLINRTGLVILVICLFISILINSGMNMKRIIKYGIILATILFIVNQSGMIGDEIIESYQLREMDDASDISTGGGRFERWAKSISALIVSPFGWKRTFYSHNMWLDLARVGGWFAFFPFLIVTIKIINNTIRMLRFNRSNFSLIIFSISISMLMAAFVEPVIEGSLTFFLLLMIVWGIISSLSRENYNLYY